MNIDSLVRNNIRTLKPYRSARSLYQSGSFFDANENAFGSVINSPFELNLNRYPDPRASVLRGALADNVGVESCTVFAGNGSDEIIDLLIRIFVDATDAVLIVEPTYGMYRVAADVAGVEVISCPLDQRFQLQSERLLNVLAPNVKLIFLCSPNNPTGATLRREDIRTICRKFKGLVIVDEAYIEFSSEASMAKEIDTLKNLVVLRTLSKAWGLAGIRIGYAIANPKIIEYLDKIKPPYNLNRVSQTLAMNALRNKDSMTQMRDDIVCARDQLSERLAVMGFKVFPSQTNFLLVKRIGASRMAKNLAEMDGLIIRNFDDVPLLNNCVRITVGTPTENALLIKAIAKRL